MRYVLSHFDVHPAATAYRKNVSIAHNARAHVRGRFLLKMDFKDFFPSLKAHDFRTFIRKAKAGFSTDEINALCRILFWIPKGTTDLRLAIGAPTSPMLSNILMLEFDRRVAKLCANRGVSYTRYADDLSFSADQSEELRLVEEWVVTLCGQLASPSLTLNHDKTVRVSKREARRVTGLVITNDRMVSLGRNEKRLIRARLHHFLTGKLSAEEGLRLAGTLAYAGSVEPRFLRRLRSHYGEEAVEKCLKFKGL